MISKGGEMHNEFYLATLTDDEKEIYKIVNGGPGTLYQNCGDFADTLTLDNMESRIGHGRNTPIGNDELSMHMSSLELNRGEKVLFRDDSLPIAVSVGDLEGDSSGLLQ